MWTDRELDGGETSLSRYALARGAGDRALVGLPLFVMRGFRHRCLLVRRDSDIVDLAQLRGHRVGLTGWPDSGNTWTRALLRRAGVRVEDVSWSLGPVEHGDVPKKHDGLALPSNVDVVSTDASLLDLLDGGALDAVMSPFMPPTLAARDGRFRFLLPDFSAAETDYFREVGFVPGIHLITLKREAVDRYPNLPAAVLRALDESKRVWLAERRRYADTTPSMLADMLRTELVFGSDWMPYGLGANAAMIAAFCDELCEQGITTTPIDSASLFEDYQRLVA